MARLQSPRDAFTRGPNPLGMLQGCSASQEDCVPSPAPLSPRGGACVDDDPMRQCISFTRGSLKDLLAESLTEAKGPLLADGDDSASPKVDTVMSPLRLRQSELPCKHISAVAGKHVGRVDTGEQGDLFHDSRFPSSPFAPTPLASSPLALSPALRSPRHTSNGPTTREPFSRGPNPLGMLQGCSASQEDYVPSPAPLSPRGGACVDDDPMRQCISFTPGSLKDLLAERLTKAKGPLLADGDDTNASAGYKKRRPPGLALPQDDDTVGDGEGEEGPSCVCLSPTWAPSALERFERERLEMERQREIDEYQERLDKMAVELRRPPSPPSLIQPPSPERFLDGFSRTPMWEGIRRAAAAMEEITTAELALLRRAVVAWDMAVKRRKAIRACKILNSTEKAIRLHSYQLAMPELKKPLAWREAAQRLQTTVQLAVLRQAHQKWHQVARSSATLRCHLVIWRVAAKRRRAARQLTHELLHAWHKTAAARALQRNVLDRLIRPIERAELRRGVACWWRATAEAVLKQRAKERATLRRAGAVAVRSTLRTATIRHLSGAFMRLHGHVGRSEPEERNSPCESARQQEIETALKSPASPVRAPGRPKHITPAKPRTTTATKAKRPAPKQPPARTERPAPRTPARVPSQQHLGGAAGQPRPQPKRDFIRENMLAVSRGGKKGKEESRAGARVRTEPTAPT